MNRVACTRKEPGTSLDFCAEDSGLSGYSHCAFALRRIKAPWLSGSHGAPWHAVQLTGTLRRLAFSTLGRLISSTPLSMLALAPAASTLAGSATVRLKAPRVISLR